jgi:DNA-binding transcriptional ArsR family regulator
MADPLSRSFAALADPTRRAILSEIARGSLTVSQIVDRHRMSQPGITKHLKVLEQAGLIRRGREGQTRPVTLEPGGLVDAAAWIERHRHFWEGAFDEMDKLLSETPAETAATREK